MKTTFLIISLLFGFVATAQISIKKNSISTSGGVMISGSQEIIYTVGETNIQEVDTGNIHLSEGFIGPDITEALGITGYGTLTGITVYPNPVKDYFMLNLPENGTYEVYFYNLQGKQILYRQTKKSEETFEVSQLPVSGYMLIVIDRKNKLKKSFKIIKD